MLSLISWQQMQFSREVEAMQHLKDQLEHRTRMIEENIQRQQDELRQIQDELQRVQGQSLQVQEHACTLTRSFCSDVLELSVVSYRCCCRKQLEDKVWCLHRGAWGAVDRRQVF